MLLVPLSGILHRPCRVTAHLVLGNALSAFPQLGLGFGCRLFGHPVTRVEYASLYRCTGVPMQ